MKFRHPLFKSQLRKHRSVFVKTSVVLLLEAALIPILPLPLRWLVDAVLPQVNSLSTVPNQTWTVEWLRSLEPFHALGIVGVISLLLGITHVVLYFFEERWTSLAVKMMVSSTRQELFSATFSRRLDFIESQRKVDLLSRMSSDVQNFEAILASGLVVFVRSMPTLLVLCFTMLWIEWRLALIVFVLLPIIYLSSQILSKRMKKWERKFREDTNQLDQEILQGLQALSILKSLRAEPALLRQLGAGQERLNHSFMKVRLFFGLFNSNLLLSRYLIRTVIIVLGGYFTIQGRISLGTLFVFASYLELMNQPIAEISNFISRYAKTLASIDRVEDYHHRLLKHPDPTGNETLSASETNIAKFQLSHLSHQYEDGTQKIFHDWSTDLPTSGLVALVGESGVGKSTFIKFLNRLQDPSSGQLTFGKKPLSDFKTEWLRQSVLIISQDPFFLSQSVRENLLLGHEPTSVTDDRLMSALKKAQLQDVVSGLPRGLDTKMGEAGVTFSGGQNKRFHLARAFLANEAKVFVFDEPSSGLDPKTSAALLMELKELSRNGKLVLFSTHRPEDLLVCDQVLFFQKNHQPVMASHQNLLAVSPSYVEFLANQEGQPL